MEMTFEEWMQKVNAALVDLCGLEADDLPDWMYADAYEEEREDFAEIAREVIEDAGYDPDEF